MPLKIIYLNNANRRRSPKPQIPVFVNGNCTDIGRNDAVNIVEHLKLPCYLVKEQNSTRCGRDNRISNLHALRHIQVGCIGFPLSHTALRESGSNENRPEKDDRRLVQHQKTSIGTGTKQSTNIAKQIHPMFLSRCEIGRLML